MTRTVSILLLAAGSIAASAQTTAKPATHTATHTVTAARPASATASTGVKLPPSIPPVKGPVVTAFTLRYQDITIGTGPLAEPRKIYKVHYTGWLAADGHKFDSSYDHPGQPIMDKDGKAETDANGNVKLSGPEPISFPQGMGRVIPGFDMGFAGMKIGGKRRIFIPWQMAYGDSGRPGPDAAHPGIPPKSDLIFDVELVDVSDFTMPANHPPMGGMHPMPGGASQQPAGQAQPAQPSQTQPAETQPK